MLDVEKLNQIIFLSDKPLPQKHRHVEAVVSDQMKPMELHRMMELKSKSFQGIQKFSRLHCIEQPQITKTILSFEHDDIEKEKREKVTFCANVSCF